MTLDLHGHCRRPTGGGRGWIITFADLICLLLAFFVMLFSLSTIDETRTKAAIYSVGQAFAPNGPGGTDEPFTGSDGEALAAADLQVELAQVFAAAIPAAKVSIIRPGRLMQVEFPADTLFLPDAAELRSGQAPLLDRIVAAMHRPPPGLRLRMEMTLGTRGGSSPADERLAMARAGAFARGIIGRGLSDDAILVGLDAGAADKVRLSFRLIGEEPPARPQ